MRIYLIGFPGSGKTYTGRRLAARLSCRFLDLDELIEKTEGRSVTEIFDRKGEAYFRKIEQKALHTSVNLDNIIISAGGGTPCFFDNIEVMKKNGIVIFTEAPVSVLKERLSGEISKRPLLKNERDITSYIEKKLKERLPYYNRADYVFHQTSKENPIEGLAIYISKIFNRNQ